MALSYTDPQLSLKQLATECEAAERRITSKSEAMVLSRKRVQCSGKSCPRWRSSIYLGVGSQIDREFDRWIGAASSVTRMIKQSVVVKIYLPTLTFGREFWGTTKGTRSRIQSAKTSFPRRVIRLSLRVRSLVLGEEPRWSSTFRGTS